MYAGKLDCELREPVPVGNKLPPVVHATLTKEQIGRGRVIVIGDIHGCNLELADLLQKCASQSSNEVLVHTNSVAEDVLVK